MSNRTKILFIPADNISANISRSYYFAKGLSKFSDVYFVTWHDHRSLQWSGGAPSKLNTLSCFIKSILQPFKIYQDERDTFLRVKSSVFIDALIGRIIGRVRGKRMMRNHNSKSLQKMIAKIKPDAIFYADSSYFFPTIDDSDITQICDVQDDVDWNEFPNDIQVSEKSYRKKQYQNYTLRYIVSKNAHNSILKNIGDFHFKVVYNGADFTELQKDYTTEIAHLKAKYNIENKYIITHIGSATWVDPVFTKNLFSEIYEKDKSIVLILVGSMDKVELPNVINVGMVPAEESYIYYNMSDLALLLKNSEGSKFLYNSVPLKNIQYGAVKKPVISFPIQWLEEEQFNNTKIIKGTDTELWIKEIQKIRSDFKWTNQDTIEWENYNWDSICSDMHQEISANLKK